MSRHEWLTLPVPIDVSVGAHLRVTVISEPAIRSQHEAARAQCFGALAVKVVRPEHCTWGGQHARETTL
jgi:hypothetical protein